MAADFEVSGVRYDLLQSIGSPRVGETNFWNWFEGVASNKERNRITNYQDPVPHVQFRLNLSFLEAVSYTSIKRYIIRETTIRCVLLSMVKTLHVLMDNHGHY